MNVPTIPMPVRPSAMRPGASFLMLASSGSAGASDGASAGAGDVDFGALGAVSDHVDTRAAMASLQSFSHDPRLEALRASILQGEERVADLSTQAQAMEAEVRRRTFGDFGTLMLCGGAVGPLLLAGHFGSLLGNWGVPVALASPFVGIGLAGLSVNALCRVRVKPYVEPLEQKGKEAEADLARLRGELEAATARLWQEELRKLQSMGEGKPDGAAEVSATETDVHLGGVRVPKRIVLREG